MGNTLTVRLAASHNRALTKRAKALGQTRSQVVRDLIEKGLEEQPLARSIGHVRGRLELTAPTSGWRRRIKSQNWR
jgi:Ribbon-helix-helix protein, copG family